jgi:2-methylcitrate dehydratase PrpD
MGAAAYEHELRASAAAREAAFLALMDSLACAFRSLQDPACAKLLGPLVPGATMAFGARVPGTSYQLDPVQAAFSIGTSVSWLQANDPTLATTSGHLADSLGAIVAVADYRARKAIAEGDSPPRVRDLFDALIGAHELASLEWARTVHGNEAVTGGKRELASAAARCALTRQASAACSVSLLRGTEEQVAAAVAIARAEMPATGHPGAVPELDGHERWRIGDATSRGVRLALVALAGQKTPRSSSPPSDEAALQLAVRVELEEAWQAVAATPAIAARVRDRFAACVATHFPAVQATRLVATFADRGKLEGLPINELVSITVRN